MLNSGRPTSNIEFLRVQFCSVTRNSQVKKYGLGRCQLSKE